ncbi:MAG: hypothetical protein FWE33_04785 [Defluviitaleaceae bacterium]|nr:hypothetical protein [Defluviitaleaceae bacterium]
MDGYVNIYESTYGFLGTLAENAESILIIALIVVIVGLAILAPFAIKWRKMSKTHELEQQNMIVNIVKENTAVMAGLKSLLKTSTEAHREDLTQMHKRFNEQSKTLTAVEIKVDKILRILEDKGRDKNDD